MRDALVERSLGAEHRAIGLHRALHLEPDRGGRAAAVGVAELVEPREREVAAVLGQRRLRRARLEHLAEPKPGRAAEHDQVDQAVRAEAVGAVDRDARRLADREQAGHDRVGIAVLQRHHLAMIIGRDSAHIVMDRRRDRDRLAGEVDAGEDLRGLGDAGQPLGEDLGVDMVEVKEDMVLMLADPAALADFHRHRA